MTSGEGAQLTPRQRQVLQALREGEELSHPVPGGWWLGEERVGGQVGMTLLRLCLIRDVSLPGEVERYVITEEGRRVLDDPAYVPECLKALRERARSGRLFNG